MSKGEIVPEVMITLLNRSKTGAMAKAGSIHLSKHTNAGAGTSLICKGFQSSKALQEKENTYVKWKTGFATVAFSVSYGSRINRKPVVA